MKNKMILWTAGMISLVVVLMIIIVSLEPPKEGITRSQAFKAAALRAVRIFPQRNRETGL